MARADKLKEAFKRCKGPFPWADFVALVRLLGYEPVAGGKTGGSRRRFYNAASGHMLVAHEPHPQREMKPYMVRQVRVQLEERGLL